LDLNVYKKELLSITNKNDISGSLSLAMIDSDVFIGVSKPGILTADMVKSMHEDSFIFALSNPVPEIMPDLAYGAGALIVATGRSDFPNQLNNVLAFPGVFRGAIDARAKKITDKMKLAAAYALANHIKNPSVDRILPSPLDKELAFVVASAVKNATLDIVS
jgi:malate dehydrogenase (oxaloacetate-decarboxylating)